MTNIVLLVKDRPRLTEQCLRTLYMHTDKREFNLTVVDDASHPETQRIVAGFPCQMVRMGKPVGVVGYLRNVGATASRLTFGRGHWLYHSDNDVAFLGEWLRVMEDRIEFLSTIKRHCVLGGYRHPFHGLATGALTTALQEDEGITLTDAVAGYSHFMSWGTWDDYGPYDQHAKGVCQSEDYAFCRKIVEAGGLVGYVDPPVIVNCGLTNSEGKPAVGWEGFKRVPGLVYE